MPQWVDIKHSGGTGLVRLHTVHDNGVPAPAIDLGPGEIKTVSVYPGTTVVLSEVEESK